MTKDDIESELRQGLECTNLKEVRVLNQRIDTFFDIHYDNSLNTLDESLYPMIESDALLTSYLDYYQILKDLDQNAFLMDVGAGYCRGSLISSLLHLPRCISVEMVAERTKWADNWIHKNQENSERLIKNQDLRESKLEYAPAYYFYFPRGKLFDELLKQIFNYVDQGKTVYLYICESHGDMLPYLESFQRVEEVDRFKSHLPRHSPDIVKYKINKLQDSLDWRYCLSEYILNANKSEFLFIHYYSQLKRENFEWLVPLRDIDLIQYGDKKALQTTKGRIISIEGEERILDIRSLDLPSIQLSSNEKLLLKANQLLIEDSFGQLRIAV